ncbi:MAG TPA: right-handed parallel beta-helix repeat-containing protein [Candidatus Limnocylindrales bacterium]|nr:right-handed parallel beta-helix repeat-containing protein [Candidatus Limnocylindrales bacterium]
MSQGRRRPALTALLGASVWLAHLSLPVPTFAKACGDDVGGARVPCACGDTVVSDTVLRAGDPVVSGRCRGDGLIVRAGELAETIVLDLAGLAIVGRGSGVGIDVDAGGNDGALINGGAEGRRGQIVGFAVGLKSRTPRAVRRLQHVEVRGQVYEGLNLRSAGTLVIDVRAASNGADGIRISGQGGRMIGVEAVGNAGAGLRVLANDVVLQGRAQDNREHGIVVTGMRNDLRGSSAVGNGGYGFLLAGREPNIEGIVAQANGVKDVGHRRKRGQR